jgi:hypothetical protein
MISAIHSNRIHDYDASLRSIDLMGIWLGKAISDTSLAQSVHDEALRTMPNLPSLARGHLYKLTPLEVSRFNLHNTHLNQPAIDAVFGQY